MPALQTSAELVDDIIEELLRSPVRKQDGFPYFMFPKGHLLIMPIVCFDSSGKDDSTPRFDTLAASAAEREACLLIHVARWHDCGRMRQGFGVA